MFKSLRWRLQAWQALILVLVITGFASALYSAIRKSQMDEVDGELLSTARVLEGTLRGFPPPLLDSADGPARSHRPRGPIRSRDEEKSRHRLPLLHGVGPPLKHDRGPPPGRPPEDRDFWPPPAGDFHRQQDEEFHRPPEDDLDRSPPEFRLGPPPPDRFPHPEHWERVLDLPRAIEARYSENEVPIYFIVWRADGSVLKSNWAEDKIPSPPLGIEPERVYKLGRGGIREIALRGPGRTLILVGRSMDRESAYLRRLLWQLASLGIGTLSIGLIGGWWLAGRAVRPIEGMSQTAAKVTASNLAERLDADKLDTELGQLASILNSMLARLEAAFHQQTQFTADASHELRTPLAIILSHLEIALARPRSIEEYRQTLEVCTRAAERMRSITENLLTLARADAGKLDLRRRKVDLKASAEESVALLVPLAERKHVNLAVEGIPTDAAVDPDRFAQVITNLVSNAILYNRKGGSVRVTTRDHGDSVELDVTDTGCGISPEHVPHIFDRFYRSDDARSRERGGNGLGLAICRSIVEAHGGTIRVQSELGIGSTFSVSLPK